MNRDRPRTQRRQTDRREARLTAQYNGNPPRYVPAAELFECDAHHRKLPCIRCAPALV